ncbi:hypothetical protein SAMN05444583_1282 [Rhodococcus maanshanensis]|uniref:Uncharacterized protein n=1 Tax=Rhodococcus maanshanensis TaxID=183556 RepID=A0A1H7WPW5_9NOCA|nr:hypothetical protein SAMN05444583_1282 [Rhodococcus maanshanensis]
MRRPRSDSRETPAARVAAGTGHSLSGDPPLRARRTHATNPAVHNPANARYGTTGVRRPRSDSRETSHRPHRSARSRTAPHGVGTRPHCFRIRIRTSPEPRRAPHTGGSWPPDLTGFDRWSTRLRDRLVSALDLGGVMRPPRPDPTSAVCVPPESRLWDSRETSAARRPWGRRTPSAGARGVHSARSSTDGAPVTTHGGEPVSGVAPEASRLPAGSAFHTHLRQSRVLNLDLDVSRESDPRSREHPGTTTQSIRAPRRSAGELHPPRTRAPGGTTGGRPRPMPAFSPRPQRMHHHLRSHTPRFARTAPRDRSQTESRERCRRGFP